MIALGDLVCSDAALVPRADLDVLGAVPIAVAVRVLAVEVHGEGLDVPGLRRHRLCHLPLRDFGGAKWREASILVERDAEDRLAPFAQKLLQVRPHRLSSGCREHLLSRALRLSICLLNISHGAEN